MHRHLYNAKSLPCRSGMAFRLCLVALASLYPNASTQAKEGGWNLESYHVQLTIAIDAPGGVAEQLAADLPSYLEHRAVASLTPLWSCSANLADGTSRMSVFFDTHYDEKESPPKLPPDKDKLLLAAVHWSSDGYELTA